MSIYTQDEELARLLVKIAEFEYHFSVAKDELCSKKNSKT
jgi:hypothetical protein